MKRAIRFRRSRRWFRSNLVSIFMSVFDCHVNRAPVAGRVTKIAHGPRLFLNADLAKASENNERNGLVIEWGSLRAKPYLPRWAMGRRA